MQQYRSLDVAFEVDFDRAFDYIADPTRLPEWTHAFAWVGRDGRTATMRTPEGEVEVELDTRVSREHGTIDTWMTFPDGTVGNAFSRLIDLGGGVTHYGFVLTAPPVELERLEGALHDQAKILANELATLKTILEDGKRAQRTS